MPTPRVSGTLYHLLPQRPRGTELLPLAMLRTLEPDLYKHHAKKYENRPHALLEPVPPLRCAWQDVVFLSPVPPDELFEALQRSGHDTASPHAATIEASALDPDRCVIRLMRHGLDGHYPEPADDDDYLPFTTAGLRAVMRVTTAAVRRLEKLEPGDPWLPWVDVPHILHRGPIPLAAFTRPADS